MATAPTTTADKPADKPAEKPVNLEMLVALMATDWLHGDRHHADELREMTLKLLDKLGDDGAAARMRLEAVPARAA